MKSYILAGLVAVSLCSAQSASVSMTVSTTSTQAILQYSSPVEQACSLKAADMNRRIFITAGSQGGGVVTITTRSPHGLAVGSVVYLEGTGVTGWDGWQAVSVVPDASHFSFQSAVTGSATTGNVGVLVDDLNSSLYPGSDQDSRPGNPNSGYHRVFVVGKRAADVAIDGNRYTRALQVNSRHHYTLTCGTQDFDQEFTTQVLPLGDTHNDGPPVDRSRPGQYSYPTVQWKNRAQSLIDPVTGVRSVRVTNPTGTASTVQTFQSAIDSYRVWNNPAGPLASGGTASFTGPCQTGNCALFLRADNLSLPGGATYNSGYGEGASLDWVAVTMSNASVNNSSCASASQLNLNARSQLRSTGSCSVVLCLTVDGVNCTSAEREVMLTNAPSNYTVGNQSAIDLWQDSGAPAIARPDVSKASGVVNYSSAKRQVTWVSGQKFSIKWTAGSRITVAGSEYQIESIQSELTLTLVSPGPVGDLYQVAYTANNFGVLVRKKTNSPDQVTIGYTTFQYGSSGMPPWVATSQQDCSSKMVVVGDVNGYNCFVNRELYWVSADGAEVRDLGFVGMSYYPDLPWSTSAVCGMYGDFDPLDGDTWYCLIPTYPFSEKKAQGIVKAHYKGGHTAYTPGGQLPDCALNGGAQPCVAFTLMQPNVADAVSNSGPAFNPEYAASGYHADYFAFSGISADGDLLIYTRESAGQDTKGWIFIYTLGDRTPAGTGPNSIRPVASMSSYLHSPLTWCVIHSMGPPAAGWVWATHNDFSYRGASAVYGMTLTSAPLTATVGGPGGLQTCQANPFNVTGQVCTDITVSGEPTRQDGSYLTNTQVGDVIRVDNEYMRILAKADSTHLTVQRGYQEVSATHAGTNLAMSCSIRNWLGNAQAVWNYRADPYGRNADRTTVLSDATYSGGHAGYGDGVMATAVGNWFRVGENVCPSAILTKNGFCYQIRRGTFGEVVTAPSLGVPEDPPFGGFLGVGNPNIVDSHPGPCTGQWCLDGRPMDGGSGDGAASMVGSAANPWVNVGGQLWRAAGGGSNLHTKTLTTMAYVGRSPLADASGPGSVIATDATSAYTYCVALKSGECRPDSTAGDVYANAPFVSKPYCDYPGIAIQGDDTNSICIGPLGAYTGNLVQFGNTVQDSRGAVTRRLGPVFSRWNQHGVFWNASMIPTGELAFSQVRWLDGVRHEDMVTVLPPYPASDSISRDTFVPVDIQIPATSSGGTNVVVEFGYLENGASDSFFCTSRQETCVAAGSAINQASPFYFAKSETYSGVACSSGCTVRVPALSQRVMYYRWKQRDAAGATVAVSDIRAMVTP